MLKSSIASSIASALQFPTLPFAFEVVGGAALGNPGGAGESGAWGGVEWNGRWVWVAEGERNPRIMREAIGMSRSRVVFGFLVSRFLWFEMLRSFLVS